MRRSFLGAALVAAALVFSVEVLADGLFRDVPVRAAAIARDARPPTFPATVKRSRTAIVDTDYLAARILPDAPMMAGAKAASKPLSVEIPAFPDVGLSLVGKSLERASDGRTIWTGHVAGQPGHAAVLVIDGSTVTGQVFDGTRMIEIRSVAGAVHTIAEIDTEAFPTHHHVAESHKPPSGTPPIGAEGDAPSLLIAPPGPARHQHAPPPIARAIASGANTTVNVYVAYTSAAAAASSNISSEIQLAVATTNTAFTNSGVTVQLNLVGSGQISYTEGSYTSSSNILTKFTTNSDGVMDTIHTLRTANNADLVALIVEDLYDACGIAWIYNGNPAYGFQVTQRSCMTSGYTFAHETGHNIGAYHDRYVHPEATSNVHAYGYVDTTNRFRTIMSYSDRCTALGISCPTVGYFSNPNVTYNGLATGIDRSLSSSADNARRFNQTASAISQFRSGTSTPLPESGWWWSTTESGRGYSLEVSGSNVFFAFYSYASDGSPVWYVSGPAAMSSSSSYFASMQQYSGGQTLSGSYQAATAIGTPGWVQINFSNDRTGTIYFWTSSTGWDSGHSITRFDFITNGSAISTASGYPQTGWWWNASEPGRGFFIEAQDTTMYVSFYMYSSTGQATWYVASGAMTSATTFTGTLSTYSGGSYFTSSSFTGPTSSSISGTVTIQFSSTTAATMTLPNGSQVALTRFTF